MDADLREFLDRVTPAKRLRDAETLVELMSRATGQEPQLNGTIIGFGSYHYEYASGRSGDGPAAAFSPRKAQSTIYLADGVTPHESQLDRLGAHTTGVGCLNIKDLEKVDLRVLEEIIASSYRAVSGP